jgi:hypothetical protein
MNSDVNWTVAARGAYGAYAAVTDNKNFRGEDMPAFDALPEKIQEAWRAAAAYAFQGGVDYARCAAPTAEVQP